MKAIKVQVSELRWHMVAPLVEMLNGEETFACQLSRVSFLVVANGECSMAWAKAVIHSRFADEMLISELRR